jgi:hypothetical protein
MHDTKSQAPIAISLRCCDRSLDTQTLANQELGQYLESQVQAIAPEPPKAGISIPQRKARSHDKNRLRWVDAKRLALIASGCADTPEVRKWLKYLNIRGLKLSMTSAWVAVRHDLSTKIKLTRTRTTQTTPSNVVSLSHYKQGARTRLFLAVASPQLPNIKNSNVPQIQV